MHLAGGILDAEALAEWHLAQRHADLGCGRHLAEGDRGVVDQPPQLGPAAVVHRLIAGDGIAGAILRLELNERWMIAVHGEPKDVDKEPPGSVDVRHVLERKSEPRCAVSH